jgi:hypothetical protein
MTSCGQGNEILKVTGDIEAWEIAAEVGNMGTRWAIHRCRARKRSFPPAPTLPNPRKDSWSGASFNIWETPTRPCPQHWARFAAGNKRAFRCVTRPGREFMAARPSWQGLAHHRDWLAAHYAPLTVLCPHNDYGPIIRGDPAFQIVYRRTSLAFYPLGMKVLLSEPDMMLFFDRVAGRMVLAALLKAASADPDHLHAAVSYAELGDRFGVSRTHVRQLLMAAERQGLVKLQARGGHRVEIQPRLWASYDRAIAGGMFLRDLVYGAATGRTAAQIVAAACQAPEGSPSTRTHAYLSPNG